MMEDTINLERLKLVDAGNPASAENIFLEVEMKTGAHVQWENGCKVAPYRKEPCIKLSGPVDSVKLAKEMLLDRMEVQSNKVTLKIDVTHFEHPSLIGKSGKLIKKVMESSGCHIHFPDVNKSPEYEKSNLVSVCGAPTNVEKARLMLRALLPVQIFFQVPATSDFQSVLDPCSPETKNIEKEFGLLLYSFKGKNGIVVVVRCNQDKFSSLRKQIPLLMEIICGRKGVELPPVHIITDIMPQHQTYVRGNNNCVLEDIKKRTGASILFPDISVARTMRNAVIISGTLDCVYMAWQDLMSYLPIMVSFDVNYTRETKGEYMNFLQDCGVIAFSNPKPKYHVKCLNLRGPEKFSKQMLQYRQHLLRLPPLVFSPDIEQTNLASKLISSTTEYFRSTYSAIPPSVANMISGDKITDCMEFRGSRFCMKTETSLQNNNWTESIMNNTDLTGGRQSAYSEINFQQNQDLIEINGDSFSEFDYQKLKVMAAKAMRRPIDSQESTQVPSSIWAGYGFSQSMPATVIKDNLDSMNHYSCIPFESSSNGSSEDSESWENFILKDCITESIWSNKKESTFSHSNYFDFQRGSPFTLKNETVEGILPEILWQHNLYNYSNIFIKEEIDYETFLLLNDEDLQTLRIPFHARKKMLCLIRDLQEKPLQKETKSFNAAPGAEREMDKKLLSNSMIKSWV